MTEIPPFVYGQISIWMRSGTPEVGVRLQNNDAELKPGYWQLQERHQEANTGLPASEVSNCFLNCI
jgi:hypothetical protein